ncbi:unnamed protein product [Boreogadus saida]
MINSTEASSLKRIWRFGDPDVTTPRPRLVAERYQTLRQDATDEAPDAELAHHVGLNSVVSDPKAGGLVEAPEERDQVARGGSGAPAPRQSLATIPFSSMSQFMYFRESKPKYLSPQFLLNHG